MTYAGGMSGRNPSAVPGDSSVEAWRVQMTAIRKMTPAERVRRWEEFNDALAAMESDALRRKYPDLTERQRFLIRMRQKHGVDLSSQVWPETANLIA